MDDLRDCFWWEPNRKIVTELETLIPCLRVFGHNIDKAAKKPLGIHYHINTMEITYVVNGIQVFSVEDTDYSVSGGEVFIAFPNEPHSTGRNPQGACEQFWMQIELVPTSNFFGLASPWCDDLLEKLQSFKMRHFKLNKNFSNALSACVEKFSSKNILDKAMAHNILLSFIYEILDQEKKQENHKHISSDIADAIEYMKNNIYNNISFEELSQISVLSVSRLKSKFTEQVGMSPMQYLNFLKIEKAKEMIKQDEKIIDIAYNLNFSSSSNFCYVFKKLVGLTPMQYKNLY